jgi:hypothetical protein
MFWRTYGLSGAGALRNPVTVFAQPRLEPVGLFCRQHHDVVLADRVGSFDGHSQRFVASLFFFRDRGRKWRVDGVHRARGLHCTGIRIVVLGETRRAVGIDALEQLPIADVNLVAEERLWHRNDQRKLGQCTAVVVGHTDHRLAVATDQNDLRGLVEKSGVGLADVKPAKCCSGPGKEDESGERRDDNQPRRRAGGKGRHANLR